MKTLNKIIILSLTALALTACPGPSSKNKTAPAVPFTNVAQCQNAALNVGGVGIPGNTACPYKGAHNSNQGYQGYAFHFQAGVGFRIDFGWDYNDMCPQVGQRPIFQNGQFSHCTGVNPLFAQVDTNGYTQPNTGECTGDQLNPDITGCKSQLRPMSPIYSPTPVNLPSVQTGAPTLNI